MARSPDKAEETSEEYGKAWAKVLDLIRDGQSWSGNERNCVFLNTGTASFADASAVSGLGFADDGRGLAPVDWDADGDLDLWLTNRTGPRVRFLLNNSENNERYIAFQLIGVGPNRDAIGAEVELHLSSHGDKRYVRTLKAGSGFISQGSKWVHFGLPDNAGVQSVTVRWPGGETANYSGAHAGARWVVSERDSSIEPWAASKREISLADGALPSKKESGAARIPIIAPLPILGLAEELPDGTSRRVDTRSSDGLLITLWADWCANCKRELNEMSASAGAIETAGVRILAVNVDDPNNRAKAASYLDKIKWPFERSNADKDFLTILETAQKTLSARPKAGAIPTSYLFDSTGKLQFIYRGALSPAQILMDVKRFSGTPVERRKSLSDYEGWWTTDVVPTRLRKMAINLRKAGLPDLAAEYLKGITLRGDQGPAPDIAINKIWGAEVNTGTELFKAGRIGAAAEAFARAVELRPESPEANKLLGVCLQRLDRDSEALVHLQRAAKNDPTDAETQNDLGLSLVKTGQIAAASEAFREAIELDPSLAKAHLNLGVYYAQTSKFTQALECTTEAARLNPDYLEAWLVAAQIHALEGRPKEALLAAEAASRLDEQNPDALFLRGGALSQLGRLNEAQAILAALEVISPTKAAQLKASLRR